MRQPCSSRPIFPISEHLPERSSMLSQALETVPPTSLSPRHGLLVVHEFGGGAWHVAPGAAAYTVNVLDIYVAGRDQYQHFSECMWLKVVGVESPLRGGGEHEVKKGKECVNFWTRARR